MCETYLKNMWEMCEKWSKNVRIKSETCEKCLKKFVKNVQKYVENNQNIFWKICEKFVKNIQNICWKSMWEMSEKYSKNIWEMTEKFSKNVQIIDEKCWRTKCRDEERKEAKRCGPNNTTLLLLRWRKFAAIPDFRFWILNEEILLGILNEVFELSCGKNNVIHKLLFQAEYFFNVLKHAGRIFSYIPNSDGVLEYFNLLCDTAG